MRQICALMQRGSGGETVQNHSAVQRAGRLCSRAHLVTAKQGEAKNLHKCIRVQTVKVLLVWAAHSMSEPIQVQLCLQLWDLEQNPKTHRWSCRLNLWSTP